MGKHYLFKIWKIKHASESLVHLIDYLYEKGSLVVINYYYMDKSMIVELITKLNFSGTNN